MIIKQIICCELSAFVIQFLYNFNFEEYQNKGYGTKASMIILEKIKIL